MDESFTIAAFLARIAVAFGRVFASGLPFPFRVIFTLGPFGAYGTFGRRRCPATFIVFVALTISTSLKLARTHVEARQCTTTAPRQGKRVRR